MNKRLSFILLAMFAFCQYVGAQQCNIRYVKEHLYYHLGDEMNVIDVDMEWPERIDGSNCLPLQKELCSMLLKVKETSFDEGYNRFKARYGEPVTGKLQSIPDDKKYCYVTCELKELGYEADRYISYALSSVSSPQPLSSQHGDTLSVFITYDLQTGRIYREEDILRSDRVANPFYSAELAELLLPYIELPDGTTAIQVADCCIVGNNVLFNLLCIGEEFASTALAAVPWEEAKTFLTKDVVKMLKNKKGKVTFESPISKQENTAEEDNDDKTYLQVDKLPEYPGGQETLTQFLSSNLNYRNIGPFEYTTGVIMVSFDVSKQGNVENVAVTKRLSPTADREAVRVVRLLRQWKPGEIAGQPVRTRLNLPISFK